MNQSLPNQPTNNQKGNLGNTMNGLALIAEMGIMMVGGLLLLPLLPFLAAAFFPISSNQVKKTKELRE